jgi:hypothetical protein
MSISLLVRLRDARRWLKTTGIGGQEAGRQTQLHVLHPVLTFFDPFLLEPAGGLEESGIASRLKPITDKKTMCVCLGDHAEACWLSVGYVSWDSVLRGGGPDANLGLGSSWAHRCDKAAALTVSLAY